MNDAKPTCGWNEAKPYRPTESEPPVRSTDGLGSKPFPYCGESSGGSATVELQFMVVPELLAALAYVPDPVRCKIVDAEAIFLTGILGESGRKLVNAGIEFYFTRPLAQKLISKGIAVESTYGRTDDLHRTNKTEKAV